MSHQQQEDWSSRLSNRILEVVISIGFAHCCICPLLIQWASYQIRKIAGCACAGNAGNVFPRHRLQRKPLVSNPGMHHGTCVTHVSWCMSGSLTRGGGENVPGIPGACALATLRIWQEAHGHAVVLHWAVAALSLHVVVGDSGMVTSMFSADLSRLLRRTYRTL